MPTAIPPSQSAASRLLSDASPAAALRERAEAILWIRTQMARHGVTPEQLLAAGCFAATERSVPAAVRYRSADGQSWDGDGAMPDWLRRAVNAGQTVEHFRVRGVMTTSRIGQRPAR